MTNTVKCPTCGFVGQFGRSITVCERCSTGVTENGRPFDVARTAEIQPESMRTLLLEALFEIRESCEHRHWFAERAHEATHRHLQPLEVIFNEFGNYYLLARFYFQCTATSLSMLEPNEKKHLIEQLKTMLDKIDEMPDRAPSPGDSN